jgi:plasminogen activator inhibitor 1 RNA-binding protein
VVLAVVEEEVLATWTAMIRAASRKLHSLSSPVIELTILTSEHPKQAAHGWGGPTGNDELADEKAGDAIAKAEEADGFDTSVPPPQNADGDTWAPDTSGDAGEPAEPEGPKSKSYEEYLAEKAEKKSALSASLEARKPNEGASKKFPEGKAFARNEEENYFAGSGGKAARFREKKEKQALDMSDVDPRLFLAEDRSAARGGRGRGRGDRGDGDGGRGRGRGEYRGGRGESRGGRGGRGDGDRPSRGEFRGGRGTRGGAAPPRADDSKAFPSLGA